MARFVLLALSAIATVALLAVPTQQCQQLDAGSLNPSCNGEVIVRTAIDQAQAPPGS